VLYRNDGGNRNQWLRVQLRGTRSNRGAWGTVVRIKTTAGTQWNMVRSGSSYCSQSKTILTFGLGPASQSPQTIELEMRWPSGAVQKIANPKPDQLLQITEPPT